jgi:hypothetical protein
MTWNAYIKVLVLSSINQIIINPFSTQRNKAMAPFRNHGWAFFSKFERLSILQPKGENNVVVPTSGVAPSSKIASGSGEVDVAKVDAAPSSRFDGGHADATGHPTLFPATPRKRKRSTLSADDDGTSTRSGMAPSLLSSMAAGEHSANEFLLEGRRPASVSSLSSNDMAPGEISPAVALHGFQASLQRFVDVFEMSLMPRPAISPRIQAITLIQKRDHYLSVEDKVSLIGKFQANERFAESYLGLDDDDLRRKWIDVMLGVSIR